VRKIAIYGKGGIGKSTCTSNLSAAIAGENYTVMHIGCDPKADSTHTLMGGRQIPTILDVLRESKKDITLDDIVFHGFNGVRCVECGGPNPGVGCAGRGIITSFELLEELHAFEEYKPDFIFYDVLGDVVCGGFAMPLRKGYAEEVYIVTSGEKMSLFAARNIGVAVENFKNRGYARLKGLIVNSRNVPHEYELVKTVADEFNTEIIMEIPRDSVVQECEEENKCVIEKKPDSSLAYMFRSLAERIIVNGDGT
jgi:nitrogenase iron protein NifH